jgi:AMMECR1 domain-containing protein
MRSESSMNHHGARNSEPIAAWNPGQLQSAVTHAHNLLCLRFGRKPLDVDTFVPPPSIAFDKVNVTIRAGGKLRASMSARGTDITEALGIAVERALHDHRYGGVLRIGELDHVAIEIWVQVFREELQSNELEVIREKMELGLHGLEMQCGNKDAYFKPSVPLILNMTSHEQVLQNLCLKAGLSPDSWKTVPMTIAVTHWLHAIRQTDGSGEGCVCRRLRVERPSDRDTLIAGVRAAAFHLAQLQGEDGSYCYLYNPFTDTGDNAVFNMVRMAGCAYAMSATAASGICEEEWCAFSASRAIDFLLRHSQKGPNGGTYISDLKTPQDGKLGSAALLVRALQYGSFVQGRLEERKLLIKGVLALQTEHGLFAGVIQKPDDLQTGQDYFPGECLSALALEPEPALQDECRNAVRRAFMPYARRFRSRPTSAFVLWQIETWVASWRRMVNQDDQIACEYAEFVFELADWILQFQHKDPSLVDRDYLGGYYPPCPPSSSSAVYTEAVIYAYTLASWLRLSSRVERYRSAARAGLRFIMKLQVPAELKGVFPRPELVLGGVTAGLSSFLMRCDYDQHFITAGLAALRAPDLLEY